MLRSSELALAALLLGVPAAGAPARPPSDPALARLSFVERRAELSTASGVHQATEGGAVRLGERLRTEADAMARLELPWMTMTVSPSSDVRFPDEYLLSAMLEQGRIQLLADKGGDILKVVTGEAEVRGRGWAVVRRSRRVTLVTSLRGRFFVEGAGGTVTLVAGTGTIVRGGQPPLAPVALPEPPDGLSPGSDPRYVVPGETFSVSWSSRGDAHQVEVLPIGSDDVLMQRDVGPPPVSLVIPWRGAFRWRVATRDRSGLEGRPSADGLITAVE